MLKERLITLIILCGLPVGGCSSSPEATPEESVLTSESNIGQQYAAIVIAHAADKTNPLTPENAEITFEKAAKQLRFCSGRQMNLVLQETVEIVLPKNIGQYRSKSGLFIDSLMEETCKYFGKSKDCSITAERDLDHVLFSVPLGLLDDYDQFHWAEGSTGGERRFSIYGGGNYIHNGVMSDGGFFIPSTIMHELGHNYRLGHALDPANDGQYAYGDATNHMGGGDSTERCFSGYSYYVLGWHQSQTNEVELRMNEARKYNVKSINDLSSGGIVNIKVHKYYLTLNLAKGITRGTGEYKNQVIIHQGKNAQFGKTTFSSYYNTRVVGALGSAGESFTPKPLDSEPPGIIDKLRIELCSIDTEGSDGAMLSIGLNATDCGTPGDIRNPRGTIVSAALNRGEPITGLSAVSGDIIEFKMEFKTTPDSVTCSTNGGSGDVDLIINYSSSPQMLFEKGVNSCYSRGVNTAQECTARRDALKQKNGVEEKNVYVALEGDDEFSGVTLKCVAEGADPVDTVGDNDGDIPLDELRPGDDGYDENTLQNGVAQTNIYAMPSEVVEYVMPMPANAESVSCRLSGGPDGDCDLYARWDAPIKLKADETVNACKAATAGNEETCSSEKLAPLGEVLHVGAVGFVRCLGVSVQCDVEVSGTESPSENSAASDATFEAEKCSEWHRTRQKTDGTVVFRRLWRRGWILWRIDDVPKAGTYTLKFRYRQQQVDSVARLIVINGEVARGNLVFPAADNSLEVGSWENILADADLVQGTNFIKVRAKDRGVSLDSMTIQSKFVD